jgi:hypothetical protein
VYTTNTAGFGATASWYTFGERAAVATSSSASRPAPLTGSSPTTSRSAIPTNDGTSYSTSRSPIPTNAATSSSASRSSIPTNAGNHSGSNSSFDVVALAAALGAVVVLGLLLVLGFFVYKRRSKKATHLSAVPNGSDIQMYPTSPAEKSYAISSTTGASPAVSSYRGSEVPGEFHHYPQQRFEVDGSNRTAELYGMRPPVEAASQARYEYAPAEAGGVNVYEAPAGTYHPTQELYQR